MTAIYRVGERVDGLYDENTDEMWYPGRIRSVHLSEATFEVIYDDGEVEMNVRSEFLRQHVAGTICVGTRVLCRYDGGEEFYPGQVSDVQEDGRYTVAYDDGEVEEDVSLEQIMEPTEKDEGKEEAEAEDPAEEEEKVPNNAMDDRPEHQQQEEQSEMEDGDSYDKIAGGANNTTAKQQENEESAHQDSELDEAAANGPAGRTHPAIPEPSSYEESPRTIDQIEDRPDATPAEVSTERAYIIESLQLLEKRLGDAASTKAVLSTLVKQMRAYPQVTADLVHERGGERLLVDALKFHQSHAVIQCYGCVLLRRLCFLCVKSTHYLLRNGIVELVIQAMNAFAEDAILQASACGALAVFTRVHSGLNILIEFQVAQLVLSTLIYHKTYSVHTRQVHYYACEVLLELCELDDLQTLNLLCGEQEEDFTGDMSPISLLLFLLRQGLSLDDKKACCAVGSLLMCLAASGRRAAALILSLNGLAELSTVMARYPTEPSIQKYSAAASKQIAMCSVRQSPTKRIKDTATEILREAESIESTPREPLPKKRTSRRSTNTGKRKSNPSTGCGAAANPRGSAYTSSTPYRSAQAFSKVTSPYEQIASEFGGDMNSYNHPVSAPQPPSSLVILDGGIGMDSGFGSTYRRKLLSKEDRQSELFDAYGIQEIPNGRPYGTKRAQLRAHLASAETTWATPLQRIPSSMKPYSSGSEHLDYGRAYSHQDSTSSRQNRWKFGTEEHQNSAYDAEPRQPRGGKRKKKNPGVRTAFQVKLENENQLRVSKEARSPYPSPQRLGAATKRAAKARHKRIAATGHSSLAGKSFSTSSESLNDYATQLFQDNASRGRTSFPTKSRLTPREKEEIRERERLSFAEKLHKMIDKAKSTLASSNTMDTAPLPPKSSKSARKTPTEKRTLASTPKQVEKEVLSPREAVETRPAKPTSRTAKRSEPSSVPVVPRPKPTVVRSVVTPKVTTDTRPRGSKTTKAVPTNPVEKTQVEKPKVTVVESTPAEAAPVVSTLEVGEPHPVKTLEQSSEEVTVAEETEPTVPVEPETSSSGAAIELEIDAVPSNAASELPVEPTPTENQAVAPSDEESKGELPGNDTEVEDAATAMETEAVDNSVSPPQAVEVGILVEPMTDAPELSEETIERPAQLEEASEPTVDLPGGGSTAAVDAMYGDTFNEFDDNEGDDEDMTAEAGADPDDTHAPATEISDPTDNPLQESKSGEALYDDYDEFDEDEPPQDEDAEVEDTPVADAADEITVLPAETESDPAENAPELEGESEGPAEDGNQSSLHDTNVDENGGDIPVEPSDSEKAEAGQEPQPEVAHIDLAPEEAPSDSDPVVGSAEGQEPVNLDIDAATEPSVENAAEEDPHSNPMDDPDKIAVGGVAESALDGGNGEEVVERGTGVSTSASVAELSEAEGAVEQNAQLEGETSERTLLGEVAVSADPTTEEAIPNPVQFQQDDEDSKDIAIPQDEPQMNDEAATLLEQDEEAKKLTADSSVASVQSAAYDEDNFDDEEAHEKAEPSEAVDAAAVEEAVQVAEPQQESELHTTPSPDPIASVSTDQEDESKTLAANSSELSVQSAGYDDDGFEDGAQEYSQAVNSEDKAPEQEPSSDENPDSVAVDTPLETAVEAEPIAPEHNGEDEAQANENEVPTTTTETYKDGDFDNAAVDEAPKEATPESAPETVDTPSELKQPDSTPTPESEVVAEPSAVTENESPDSLAQEEATETVQEPANVDAEKDEDAWQVDDNVGSTTEGESVLAAEPDTDDITESSAPVSTGNPATAPATSDTLEDEVSETNTLTEDVPVQEEAEAEQPASYDDDNFADEEEATPSVANEEPDLVAKEAADEGLEGEELELQPSEQPGGEIGESVDTKENTVAEEETPPQADLEEFSHPKQPEENAVDSSVVLDKPDDSVSDLAPETGNPSEEVEDHIEAPTESEANVDPVSDEVGDSMPEVEPSQAELTVTPAGQPGDQDASISPDDESPETENSPDTPQTENVPDPEVESDTKVESSDSATGLPSQGAATTEETGEETSPESEHRPDDIIPVADTPADPSEPSVDDTQGETEYDAEFDGAENDAALVKDDNEPIQNEIGANEEAAPEDNVSVEQSTGSAAAEVDDPASANVDLEASNPAATGEETNAEADVDPTSTSVDLDANDPTPTEEETKAEPDVDASQYEEDFPDEASPESQDTESISTKFEVADNDNAPTEAAIDPNPDNDSPALDENVSELAQSSSDVVAVPDPPKDGLFDDGFDDDNTIPSIDPSSTADGDFTSNKDEDALEDNTDAMQGEADAKVEESDVAEQQTETPIRNGPVESESAMSEAVESVPIEPETVETTPVEVEVEDSTSMEPETVGVEVDSAPMEPEVGTSAVETNESGTETLESNAIQDEDVEPVIVQSEVEELESGEVDAVESEGVESENTESQAADPPEKTLTAESHGADPEPIESAPVDAETAGTIASVPEGQGENILVDSPREDPATPKAGQEELLSEPSKVSIPIESNSEISPAIEVPVEVQEDTLTERNVQSLAEDGSATGEAKEEEPHEEKASAEEVVVNPLQREEPVEDTASSSVEEPPAENPVEAAPGEQDQPVQSEAENTLEADPLSSEDTCLADDNSGGAVNSTDPVSQENQEVAVDSSSMGDADQVNEDPVDTTTEPTETPEPAEAILESSNEVQPTVDDKPSVESDYLYQEDQEVPAESPSTNDEVKNDVARVSAATVEATSEPIETPEPAEVIVEPSHEKQLTAEDEASVDPDYAEDDAPVVLQDESKATEGLTEVEDAESLPQESAVPESVNAPEAEELAIENESPAPDQIVADTAGSEGPKTEDQYDDDDAYNEFDDQENESPLAVEVPAPATATTTKATEDEYDEYENDDYGEEEKPSEIEPEATSSTHSNPPASAREEEVEEVADEPEEAEEDAYADDQDEYEEDEAPPTVSKGSSSPKQAKSVPQAEVEASADEYEDDNEEEDYADDEIEDSSPPKPAPAVRATKSDDEMEEELESEEDYASD